MKLIHILPVILLFSCGTSVEKETKTESEDPQKEDRMDKGVDMTGITNLTNDEFEEKIKSDCIVLDVRTPEEVEKGVIGKPIVMDFYDSDFAEQLRKLDTSKAVYVYCRAGRRSLLAGEILVKMGFEVYNLTGGTNSWIEEGKALVDL